MKYVPSDAYYFLLNRYRRLRQEFARLLFYKKIYNIVQERKHLKLFEIDKLAADIPQNYYFAYTPEKYAQNDYYGIATTLKKYAGLPNNQPLDFAIEHGIDFYSDGGDYDVRSAASAILTFSNYRKERLQRATKKEIRCIGPFIYYAPHFLSVQELKSEKKRLGKNLLVFPAHSCHGGHIKMYQIDQFCEYIKKIGKDFDSIRICLYWKDILMGTAESYHKYGFECVTAGHIFDPKFLSRLKSIIETSSMTISNGLGTHVGYCILMDKPHFYFKQEVKIKEAMFPESADSLRIKEAFSNFSTKITSQQREIIDYYWGISELKTSAELKTTLTINKK